jgi:cyclophilin family peptidyl-prolyl cis-trans isomerase/HEAT repeat protein
MLEVEDARAEDVSPLLEGLRSSDPRLQRLAARGLGRLERPEHASALLPLLDSSVAEVRAEVVNALGQMGAGLDLGPFLTKETDGYVRGVFYETIGRLPQADETLLRRGLSEPDLAARIGAAKGLEAFFRRTKRAPGSETVARLREAAGERGSPLLCALALLTLNAAGDFHPPTLSAALEDPEPQVRRLAVIGGKEWKEDPSPMVRYEALRLAGNCERAEAALRDSSPHVALLAIDLLGNGCSAKTLAREVDEAGDWRRRSRALVSLAKVDADAARARLGDFVEHRRFQARAYAAAAAKILKDEGARRRLLRDAHPNVVRAALETPEEALEALSSPDYGLLMEAGERLKGWTGERAVPALFRALERLTAERRATSRDPRRLMIERIAELADRAALERLRARVSDFDPFVARLAAETLSRGTGERVTPRTARFAPTPLPDETFLRGLAGGRARIRMQEAGTFIIDFIPEEAPVTVAAFARLAEAGYYNGLTFHRIVPNFVIQGGSPGANEYVGAADYLRDELGLLSHRRGTLGISTRGRDTGDAQIFVNLVDNFRLDHNYTVFARVSEGMEVVDRIQEGEVMESVEILRRRSAGPDAGTR